MVQRWLGGVSNPIREAWTIGVKGEFLKVVTFKLNFEGQAGVNQVTKRAVSVRQDERRNTPGEGPCGWAPLAILIWAAEWRVSLKCPEVSGELPCLAVLCRYAINLRGWASWAKGLIPHLDLPFFQQAQGKREEHIVRQAMSCRSNPGLTIPKIPLPPTSHSGSWPLEVLFG